MSQAAMADSTLAPASLAALSIEDLIVLHEAYEHLSLACLSLLHQPRAVGTLSEVLSDEWERCNVLADQVEDLVAGMKIEGAGRLAQLAFLSRVALKAENYERAASLATQAAIQNAADWSAFQAKHMPAPA